MQVGLPTGSVSYLLAQFSTLPFPWTLAPGEASRRILVHLQQVRHLHPGARHLGATGLHTRYGRWANDEGGTNPHMQIWYRGDPMEAFEWHSFLARFHEQTFWLNTFHGVLVVN